MRTLKWLLPIVLAVITGWLIRNYPNREAQPVPPTPTQEPQDFRVGAVGSSGEYAEYINARFGFAVRFPAKLFIPQQGETEYGDGQIFVSYDKKTRLVVFGFSDTPDKTLKNKFEEELQGGPEHRSSRQVTFKTFRGNWYVVSGFDKDTIFYKKQFFVKDHFVGFEITYPAEQRKLWDKVVIELGRGFKADFKSAPTDNRKVHIIKENEALDLLIKSIEGTGLYADWTKMECLIVLTEDSTEKYFDFAIREKHKDDCPGDPNTAPLVDRFRVDRVTGQILWYDLLSDAYFPFNRVIEQRKTK